MTKINSNVIPFLDSFFFTKQYTVYNLRILAWPWFIKLEKLTTSAGVWASRTVVKCLSQWQLPKTDLCGPAWSTCDSSHLRKLELQPCIIKPGFQASPSWQRLWAMLSSFCMIHCVSWIQMWDLKLNLKPREVKCVMLVKHLLWPAS